MKRRVAVIALAAATPADAHRHHDGYNAPTDTHVDLVLGLWHDDALRPGEGWHRYGFTAEATADVAVQMRAPVDAATMWSYLRVDGGGTSWAGVANRRTNLCEIILHVERGAHYDVIATSQRNASLGPTARPLRFGDGRAIAADDAVHAFYALEPGELAAMVLVIAALHRHPLGPLAPHPLLVAQGLRGELGTSLADLVQRHAGPRNLVRLTVLTSSGLGTAWNFAGVDLAGDLATPIAIPGLPGARVEGFFAGFAPHIIAPAFAPPPRLAPADDLRLARSAAMRIEAPALHDASTIDCASCHAAQTLRSGATEVDLHMFGYRGATPSIQQRTINEVAASLAYLRAHP